MPKWPYCFIRQRYFSCFVHCNKTVAVPDKSVNGFSVRESLIIMALFLVLFFRKSKVE